ncbi:MAG: VanZ family protein [Thermoanaerobaculia bacterium]
MRRAELTRFWTPALLWAAVLLIPSGGAGSAHFTGSALQFVLSHTFGELSDVTFAALHFIIRKTVHLVAYGILGALNFRAVRAGRTGWGLRWSVIATVLAVIVASLDEWHQTMVPSRTGMPADVLLDAVGATIAQLVWRHRSLSVSPETSSPPS